MKKLLSYTILTLIILAVIFGAGAEPKPETTIAGFFLYKITFAFVTVALVSVFKNLELQKYL